MYLRLQELKESNKSLVECRYELSHARTSASLLEDKLAGSQSECAGLQSRVRLLESDLHDGIAAQARALAEASEQVIAAQSKAAADVLHAQSRAEDTVLAAQRQASADVMSAKAEAESAARSAADARRSLLTLQQVAVVL